MHTLQMATLAMPTVGLPPDKSLGYFFANSVGIQTVLLLALIIAIMVTYWVLIRHENDLKQILGFALCLVWLTVFADGLKSLQGIVVGLVKLGWSWLTSS